MPAEDFRRRSAPLRLVAADVSPLTLSCWENGADPRRLLRFDGNSESIGEMTSIGLGQKCGGSGTVLPFHCATRVRISVIFILGLRGSSPQNRPNRRHR